MPQETADPGVHANAYRIEEFGRPLRPFRGPAALPRGKEVLLRTRRCGVCHSDLHLADGYFDLGGGRTLQMADHGLAPPLTPGHEIVGELVAAGPDAALDGRAIGRSYLVWPWIGCGRCAPCRRGAGNLCAAPRTLGIQRVGGYSDMLVVPEARYLLDIDGLDPSAAATLACSGLTAYSALAKATAARDDWLCLIGMGGVGSAGLLIAKGLGHELVAAVDIDPGKRDWAQRHGADVVVDATAPDPATLLRRATGGGVDTVVDFVGSAQSAQLGLDILLRGGTYIIVGMLGGEIALPLPLLPTRAISIRGSYTGTLAELEALVALARSGQIPPLPVQTIPPTQINEALDRLRQGTAPLRQVIAYD